MPQCIQVILMLVFFFFQRDFGIARADEYQVVNLKESGSISGRVLLKGPVPDPRIFHLVLYPFEYFCKNVSDGKQNRLLSEFEVGADGSLKDTVITLKEIAKGKPFPDSELTIRSTNCDFHPFVSVVKKVQPVKVINEDPVVHNIQVYESEREDILFNAPLPVRETATGILKFHKGVHVAQWICGMHEYMQNWTYLVENPYYAITPSDGAFRIDRIPPGTYTVTAWHNRLKTAEQQVTVVAGDNTPVNFEFRSEEVIYPEYEKQEKGRIQQRGKAENYIK